MTHFANAVPHQFHNVPVDTRPYARQALRKSGIPSVGVSVYTFAWREQARPPCFAAGPRPLASPRHTGGLRAAASGSRELLTVEQAQRALDLQASRSALLRADAPAAPAPGPRCCSAHALHQLCKSFSVNMSWSSPHGGCQQRRRGVR